jgi:hypothetical protein
LFVGTPAVGIVDHADEIGLQFGVEEFEQSAAATVEININAAPTGRRSKLMPSPCRLICSPITRDPNVSCASEAFTEKYIHGTTASLATAGSGKVNVTFAFAEACIGR